MTTPQDSSTPRLGADAPLERGLTALATRRPVGVTMVVLTIIVFGLISLDRLPRNLMPDISYPSITVRTEYPGASPIDVEGRVSRRLEESLSQVRDLRRISSISRAETSDVLLEFAWGSNMALATADVREKVAQAFLPDEAETPTILRYDPTLDPIIQFGMFLTDASADDQAALVGLRILAEDEIERELETVPGVAGVRVRGGLEPEVRIEVAEQSLREKGLAFDLISQRIQEENLNQASGIIYEGENARVVRTVNEFRTVDEIRGLQLVSEPVPVHLRDLAEVTSSFEEPEVITRIDGRACVKIDIFKEADANIVEVAERVRRRLFGSQADREKLAKVEKMDEERRKEFAEKTLVLKTEKSDEGEDAKKKGKGAGRGGDHIPSRPDFIASRLPSNVKVEVMSDQSVFIENSLTDVRSMVLGGGVLAILILFLFLRRLSFTLAVGVSIPLSIVTAFIAMHLFGVSINMMSLGGLALGIGMLVDNSIVVLESIFRCREEGDDPVTASIRGTRAVASAVTASTLTTVAVFFPIVFVEGVAGQIFRDQALTVVISLVASLAVALYFIPSLVCRSLGSGDGEKTLGWRAPRLIKTVFRRPTWRVVVHSVRRPNGRWYRFPLWLVNLILSPLNFLLIFVMKWLTLAVLAISLLVIGIYRVCLRLLSPFTNLGQKGLFWVFDAALEALRRVYVRFLEGALRQRFVVAVVVGVLAFFAFRLVSDLENELIPEVHQGEFTVEVRLPRATRLEKTDDVIRPWEEFLLDKRRFPEIDTLTTTVGIEKDDVTAGDDGEHTAKLLVRLERSSDPERTEEIVKARIRESLSSARLGSAEIESTEFKNPVLFSFKMPIEVEVKGRNLGTLTRVTDDVEERMRGLEEIKDVRSSLARGSPEVRILPDRRLYQRYGLSPVAVGDVLRKKLLGEVKTHFSVGDRKVPIRVRLREDHRDSLGALDELVINPGSEREYQLRDVRRWATREDLASSESSSQGSDALSNDPLAALAAGAGGRGGEGVIGTARPAASDVDLVRGLPIIDGPAEIRRIGHERAAVVSANFSGMSLGGATESVEEILREVPRPANFTVEFGGQNDEMEKASGSLRQALLLAVFLVFVVMAMQFESFTQPLVIIVAVPLAFVGVLPVLWFLEIPLSIVVFIGMIVLAGIVVNNAIVLVDTSNQLRKQGLSPPDSLLRAGELRLRPILMTSLTTVLGLLPLTGILSSVPGVAAVLGGGDGAEIREPLAITVVAGLVASTVLTLVVVPVIASLADSLFGRGRAATEAES